MKSELEFRIFHILFCDEYKLTRSSFAFDVYVQHIFEKYLLDTISIQPLDWLLIAVLTMLNWGRVSLGLGDGNCGEHDEECIVAHAMNLFIFAGIHV